MKILFIDDEAELLSLSKFILEEKGHEVQTSENASKAIENFDIARFDLVITDKKMPGISGVELAEKCHSDGIKTLFIIVTGDNFKDTNVTELDNVVDLLEKPIDYAQLAEKIHDIKLSH